MIHWLILITHTVWMMQPAERNTDKSVDESEWMFLVNRFNRIQVNGLNKKKNATKKGNWIRVTCGKGHREISERIWMNLFSEQIQKTHWTESKPVFKYVINWIRVTSRKGHWQISGQNSEQIWMNLFREQIQKTHWTESKTVVKKKKKNLSKTAERIADKTNLN